MINLHNFFTYYDPKNQAHRDAVTLLFADLEIGFPSLLNDDAPWVLKYRGQDEQLPNDLDSSAEPKFRQVITPELMEEITGYSASTYNDVFCRDFNALLGSLGFSDDVTACRMLIAQCMHETGGTRWFKELGDEGYFINLYEYRDDLQNTEPGDGYLFRGCGAIHLTGRGNFQRFDDYLRSKGINDPRVMEEGTDYVADKYPFTCCTQWLLDNDYLNVCKTGDVVYATRVLNGGLNGLDDREYWYEKVSGLVYF